MAPLSRAAVAAGADGLIIEVHPDPPHALSDAAQQLRPEQYAALMEELGRIAAVMGRASSQVQGAVRDAIAKP